MHRDISKDHFVVLSNVYLTYFHKVPKLVMIAKYDCELSGTFILMHRINRVPHNIKTKNITFWKCAFYIILGGHPSGASGGIRGHPKSDMRALRGIRRMSANAQTLQNAAIMGHPNAGT